MIVLGLNVVRTEVGSATVVQTRIRKEGASQIKVPVFGLPLLDLGACMSKQGCNVLTFLGV